MVIWRKTIQCRDILCGVSFYQYFTSCEWVSFNRGFTSSECPLTEVWVSFNRGLTVFQSCRSNNGIRSSLKRVKGVLWIWVHNFTIIIFQDAFPLGEVVIGSSGEGFSVDENAPDDLGGGEGAFVLNTTTRTFPLLAETPEEKHSWVHVLREAIERAGTSPSEQDRGTSYSRD